MQNSDTHFMTGRDALLTRNEGHAEWLRLQEAVWRERSAAYGRLDWVGKQDFLNKMIDVCEPQPSWAVLDVGTGPGIIASEVVKHTESVVGVDLSPEMIESAEQKHGSTANLSFRVGNAEALDFPDNTFDLVTARMVFHHVGDVFRGAGEVWRVLKPGGLFVLCEGVPPDHLTRQRYEDIFKLKEERHTFSEADLINLFDHAGFEDILVRPFFMRQVSLNNWLANGALEPAVIEEIRRLHTDADDHFKRVYRLNERDGDVFMDWKFIFVRGRKPADLRPEGVR
jgi:ubiquinone/menaquinone biosynthesis C-methylase UbiE